VLFQMMTSSQEPAQDEWTLYESLVEGDLGILGSWLIGSQIIVTDTSFDTESCPDMLFCS
jgi:hypothetical protein